MKVVIYSGSFCPGCIQAKQYFDEKGIDYEVKNIDENHGNLIEMTEVYGSEVMPTIVINEEHIIQGFSPKQIEEALDD